MRDLPVDRGKNKRNFFWRNAVERGARASHVAREKKERVRDYERLVKIGYIAAAVISSSFSSNEETVEPLIKEGALSSI